MQDRSSRFLADKLRQERIGAGLKQSELAAKLGVPQSQVSKNESGERKVGVLELLVLCRALQVPAADFVAILDNRLEDSDG